MPDRIKFRTDWDVQALLPIQVQHFLPSPQLYTLSGIPSSADMQARGLRRRIPQLRTLLCQPRPLEHLQSVPFHLFSPNTEFIRPPELDITYQEQLSSFSFSSPITQQSKDIEELEQLLRDAYLGSTGVEFSHINDFQER